jgi:GMP synthase-like glutamine amidotransferase
MSTIANAVQGPYLKGIALSEPPRMKLTIVQTGAVPAHLQPQFNDYPLMFRQMFETTGEGLSFGDVDAQAEALPDPAALDGIVITGSPAGVYEDHAWLPPLRDFIRRAYQNGTPMLGVCFGHQIMADALGGEVQKSDKGWGLGRHTYRVTRQAPFLANAPETLSVACSHQDQVIVVPEAADVFLASDFAPHAGLVYRNGRAMSVQPHPEFEDSYATALVEMRRGKAPEPVIETALGSMETASDSQKLREMIRAFFDSTR